MENKKKIEFIAGAILIVLLLALILNILYFNPKDYNNKNSIRVYERSSTEVLGEELYYGRVYARDVFQNDRFYYERINEKDLTIIDGKFYSQNEFYFEKNYRRSNLKITIN